MAALAWLVADREREPGRFGPLVRAGIAKLRGAAHRHSAASRHALRFGAAMAIGVAIYRLAGFTDHGYWVPLTILFVLKPEAHQTTERIAMRAAGTFFGLILATLLAELLTEDLIPVTIILVTSVALSYALLAIEYALFTTAITVYVVLLTDTLGASPFDAAGERGLGTLLGIVVAALAFRTYGDHAERRDEHARRGGCEAFGRGSQGESAWTRPLEALSRVLRARITVMSTRARIHSEPACSASQALRSRLGAFRHQDSVRSSRNSRSSTRSRSISIAG